MKAIKNRFYRVSSYEHDVEKFFYEEQDARDFYEATILDIKETYVGADKEDVVEDYGDTQTTEVHVKTYGEQISIISIEIERLNIE